MRSDTMINNVTVTRRAFVQMLGAGGAIADLANAAEWLVFGQPYWVENAIFGIEMESV